MSLSRLCVSTSLRDVVATPCLPARVLYYLFLRPSLCLTAAGTAAECATCRLRMVVRFQPKIAFVGGGAVSSSGNTSSGRSLGRGEAGGTNVIAVVESTQSTVRDLLPSDFILSCDRCSATMKIREIMSGKQVMTMEKFLHVRHRARA